MSHCLRHSHTHCSQCFCGMLYQRAISSLHIKSYQERPSTAVYSILYNDSLRLLLLVCNGCPVLATSIDVDEPGKEFVDRNSNAGFVVGKDDKKYGIHAKTKKEKGFCKFQLSQE